MVWIGFCVNMQVGKLEEWSQGENRGEKPRHREFRTTQPPGVKFAPPYPFVRNHFCEHFAKACFWFLPKISVRKCTGMWTLCKIRTALLHLCEIRTTLLHLCEIAPLYPPVRNSHHPTPISETVGHILITYQCSFHAYYILFQILGSQESIASNGTRFGVETKKLWPFEDDCAKLNGNVAAAPHFATFGKVITTQKVLFYTFNSLCFKHFCVVVLHLYPNWHVKDLAMTFNHICG